MRLGGALRSMEKSPEALERIRQQFENAPYPKIPLEKSPKEDVNNLFIHNLVTAYYLKNQRILDTQGKVILDAGCGSGYKSLMLAEANPGAKIVGIDISPESVKLARERLPYHGFENVEFHAIGIEEVPKLGMQFDYINSDDVLYFLDDLAAGMGALQSVLKPEGLIRGNLHCALGRAHYLQAQQVFSMMGLADEPSQDLAVGMVRETIHSLRDEVKLKALTWNPSFDTYDERILANYLLKGDRGYTIPEMFAALRAAQLEFVSMVHWRHWDLMSLFKDPENLPIFLGMSLPELSIEEQLHFFELLNPRNRLIDFWCARSDWEVNHVKPIPAWEPEDWWGATVHLHPQVRTERLKANLIDCIRQRKSFNISRYLTEPVTQPVVLDSTLAACLLPLWAAPQSFQSLVERWLRIRPLNPETLEATSQDAAFQDIQQLLTNLETFLFVLLERSQ